MVTFVLFMLLIYNTESICVKDKANLLCTNEFQFRKTYPGINSLTLINSFISDSKLKSKFKDLKVVFVEGQYVHETCESLTDIRIIGCETGNLVDSDLQLISLTAHVI